MKLVSVKNLKGNEVLAVPVITSSDMVLIQSDTVLKDEYIDKLRDMNIDEVYVRDASDDTEGGKDAPDDGDEAGDSSERSESGEQSHFYTVEDTFESSKKILAKAPYLQTQF